LKGGWRPYAKKMRGCETMMPEALNKKTDLEKNAPEIMQLK
jgi:type II secretory pathway component PulM